MTNNQIRGESMYSDGKDIWKKRETNFYSFDLFLKQNKTNKGCFGKTGARVWIFLAFLMSFGSLIGAIWIFFDYYVSRSELSTYFLISCIIKDKNNKRLLGIGEGWPV